MITKHKTYYIDLGPDESHTIHKLRATTVILEEDSSFDEPVIANIILPNKPHSTALQVEEMGSFTLESNQQSYSYRTSSVDGGSIVHGVVDEIDSDSDHNLSYKRSVSRNVSIVSASDDESSLGASVGNSSKDISIDEYQKDVQFEDGIAHIQFRKTVIEEQEIVLVDDIADARRPQIGNLADMAKSEFKTDTTPFVGAKPTENENQNTSQHAKKLNIERCDENKTEDNCKQMRINEIQSNAGKALLLTREEGKEEAAPAASNNQAVLSNQTPGKSEICDNDNEQKTKSLNGGDTDDYENDRDEEEADKDLANLYKRIQKQRSVLNEIISNEQQIVAQQDTPKRIAIVSDDNVTSPGSY